MALPVYETAGIFPMLTKKAEATKSTQAMTMTLSQFSDQLENDQGIKEPIIIWDGMLVDGRNRRAAAEIAVKRLQKIEGRTPEQDKALEELSFPPVREENFASNMEADRFIVALNIARRQMTKSQTAAVSALYWELYEGRIGRNAVKNHGVRGDTRDILARMFHVNNTYIDAAHKLLISDPDNFKQLHAGSKSLSDTKKSPGQNSKPDTDPNEVALKQINDAFGKIKSAMTTLSKSNGDTYASAKKNIQSKLEKMTEQFNKEFGH